jgi:tetratricopeptide (TPR) repeat protein
MAAENIRIGVLDMRQGVYDKAVAYFLRALDISEKNKNVFGQLEANLTLGEIYMRQGKFDIALKYYHLAEKLNSQLPPLTCR